MLTTKKFLFSLASLLSILSIVSSNAFASTLYATGSIGVDVSYPNCTNTLPKVSYGVVGVEDGLGFSQNPCLSKQAVHFSNLSLYANSGYPGSTSSNAQKYMNSPKLCAQSDLNCIAYDYGYNQGLYAFNYASSVNAYTTKWWVDVETANSWTSDSIQNQNSLQGEHDALIASGATSVGVYSTTAQWNSITGSWLNNWISWGATTWTTAKQAQTYCTGHQFTGGQSILMQYKNKTSALDHDVAC